VKSAQLEHLDGKARLPRRRIALRLGVALLAFVILDVFVRVRSGALEASFYASYRLPDVRVPPLDEFSDAVKAHRQAFPRRISIGLAGPSNVWGHWLTSPQSIPSRLEARLRQAGHEVDVFNLSMVRNRYSDDRAVAAYFSGAIDVVLVPYAPLQFVEQCPSHPDVIAWSGQIPETVGATAGCPPIARHRTNAALEGVMRSIWATYRHRSAVRHLVFPDSGDLGRAMYSSVWGRFGVNQPQPIDEPPSSPRISTDIAPVAPPADVATEVAGVCHAYAAGNTRVFFYRFPTAAGDTPDAAEKAGAQIKGFESVMGELHAAEPRCERLETSEWRLGRLTMFDGVHPTALGSDRIAAVLADAVGALLARPDLAKTGTSP
jgi:hypothetical protein